MKRGREAGDRIKALRGNLTQAEFAKSFGVTQSMISAWESGRDTPSAEIWIMLGETAGYPDCYWFYERAGLDRQKLLAATEKTLRDQIKDADSPLLEGQIVLVPRVRKTSRGLEPTGLPLPMAAEAIPNPLSTYCFVLESCQAVLDTADASAASLLPFWGQIVLIEIEPQSQGEIAEPPFIEGLFIGALYGPDEISLPGRRDWHAYFLPLSGDTSLRHPELVGLWTEATFEPIKPTIHAEGQRIATWEEIKKSFIARARDLYPRVEGESDEAWLARATELEGKRQAPRMEEIAMDAMRLMQERYQRAASEMRLIHRCKVLGRVVAQLPLPATKVDS